MYSDSFVVSARNCLAFTLAIFEQLFASVSKRSFMRIHAHENEFNQCQQVHFHVNQTYFHKKGFAQRLVLKQAHCNSQMANCIALKKSQQ